ncbi:MAG: hypothetical protein ABI927_01070 [Gaiellaceae bacterium]
MSTNRPERARYDDICDALTEWHPEVRASKVFGMPCLKRSGRVIAGFSRTGMVFKLTDPAVHARALAIKGAHLFDPSGRGNTVFRQWVVVPPEQAKEWESLAYDALGQDHAIPAPAPAKPAPPLPGGSVQPTPPAA